MSKKVYPRFGLILAVIALVISACSLSEGQAKTSTPPVEMASTDTPAASPIPASTATSAPTIKATATLVPTAAPTDTPLPSATTAPQPSATTALEPSATTAPVDNSGEAKQLIIDAFNKINTAYPFRVTETGNFFSGNGTNSTRITEFAAADRTHTTLQGTSADGEEIRIGDKVYIKLNGGSWTAASQSSQPGVDFTQLAAMLASSLTDIQSTGSENLNGVDTLSYTFSVSLGGSTGTGKVWIGAADGFVYRVDLSSVVQGVTLSETLTYEYNIQVTIEAPIP